MTVFQAVVLGIIQGLTEFLPISSSGHLVFVPKIFGWADQGLSFDVIVHLGTLVAVVVYFRKKLLKILLSMFKKQYPISNIQYPNKLGWFLLLTIIPAAVVGLLFGDWIEQNLRSATVIGIGLIFWGLVLGLADKLGKKTQDLDKVNWKSALFIGCAQAIALIPGTSRSGITMTAGLFSKLNKKSAAEFSFLMSAPIILIAGLVKLFELIQTGFGEIGILALSIGLVASAVSGFIAIWGLIKIIQRWNFLPFVIYRVAVGVLILVWLV